MAIPNKGSGGPVQTSRKRASPYNVDGTSRAQFADQKNEEGWVHEGRMIDGPDGQEEARQCAAADERLRKCAECGEIFPYKTSTEPCKGCGASPIFLESVRCQRIAVPGYMTCVGHGGGFKLSPQHKAALMRANVKTGMNFNQILYCACNMFGDTCEYKNMYFDDDGCCRCYIEKLVFDSVVDHFISTYNLDEVADMIILQRLAMTILRIMRNEKWVAARGEVVERIRSSPDGSVERWFEANASSQIIAKLDSQLLSWLKSLDVTRQGRNAAARNAKGVGDLAALLSDVTVSTSQVIEIDEGDS